MHHSGVATSLGRQHILSSSHRHHTDIYMMALQSLWVSFENCSLIKKERWPKEA